MNKRPISPQRARELALYQYCNALERGDFKTVAAISRLAERDPILDGMISEMHELEAAPPEREQAAPIALPHRHGISIVRLNREPSPNGWPPKPDTLEEDNDMNTTYSNAIRTGSHRLQFLTAFAAAVILILFGVLVIDMVGEPIGGLPIFGAVQTEEPACVSDTVIDMNAESVRLAGEAMTLLETAEADRTPEMIEQAALLAICAARTAYTSKADDALQRAMISLEIVPQFPGHTRDINSAVFSPDGSEVLIGGSFEIHLWDIATASEVRTFSFPREVPGFRLSQAVFSPDGQYILAAANWNTGRLLNSETGEALRDFDAGIEITHLAYSPDNLYAALGLIDGSVHLWNVNTGVLEQTFQVHDDYIGELVFSPDGGALLVGGETTQYEVYLVNLETGEQRAFVGLRDFSNGVAFSPDGQYVLAGGDTSDRRAILWDTETGEQVHIFSGFINDVTAVTFSPDGQYVLVGSADRTARVFDVESGAEVRSFRQNDSYIGSVAFSPDGNMVLLGSVEGSVRLWPTTIEDTVALACQTFIRDFTMEERARYQLGEGTPCAV